MSPNNQTTKQKPQTNKNQKPKPNQLTNQPTKNQREERISEGSMLRTEWSKGQDRSWGAIQEGQ